MKKTLTILLLSVCFLCEGQITDPERRFHYLTDTTISGRTVVGSTGDRGKWVLTGSGLKPFSSIWSEVIITPASCLYRITQTDSTGVIVLYTDETGSWKELSLPKGSKVIFLGFNRQPIDSSKNITIGYQSRSNIESIMIGYPPDYTTEALHLNEEGQRRVGQTIDSLLKKPIKKD